MEFAVQVDTWDTCQVITMWVKGLCKSLPWVSDDFYRMKVGGNLTSHAPSPPARRHIQMSYSLLF